MVVVVVIIIVVEAVEEEVSPMLELEEMMDMEWFLINLPLVVMGMRIVEVEVEEEGEERDGMIEIVSHNAIGIGTEIEIEDKNVIEEIEIDRVTDLVAIEMMSSYQIEKDIEKEMVRKIDIESRIDIDMMRKIGSEIEIEKEIRVVIEKGKDGEMMKGKIDPEVHHHHHVGIIVE